MTRINTNSDFWTGNVTGSSDMWWRLDDETPKKGKDLVALAGYRRAIANFVNIVTNRTDIPVVYNNNDHSFTDGGKVVLSGNINEKNFDPSVGLALHEGSHIVHSDFELLRELKVEIASHYKINQAKLDYYSDEYNKFYDMVEKIKDLLNYVEDRRIDYLTFRSAPGYKNYYHAMYDKYFNFRVINKGLKSGEYRDASEYKSYEFRIINFTNVNTDLDALPGLRDIYRLVDLKNISRLKTTEEALKVAFGMYDIIMENLVPKPEIPTPNPESGKGEASEEESSGGSNGKGTEVDTGDHKMTAGEGEATSDEGASGSTPSVDFPELSDNEKKSLENAFDKQKKLTNGEMRKTKLTKKDNQSLKAVEESGAYNTEVGPDKFSKTNCVVVPHINDSMIPGKYERSVYHFITSNRWSEGNDVVIADGLRIGTILGKKLQIRNEERSLKWTRQDSGRIDKRLIAELGFDNTNVFQTTFVEKFDDAFLHVSIDASGSMSGDKWKNSLKAAAAISKAASMTGNIHVQVSIRTTEGDNPLIAIIYDSKVNKIVHIKKYWKNLRCTGTTPEGLCFEAIEKQILGDSNGRDAYFLNLSDGMPYYSNGNMYYSGERAFKHTAEKVEMFKKSGIKILSFFVTDGWGYGNDKETMKDFKRMYGKDSVDIDVTSVVSLAKVLNGKFLEG
jgi:hypothetical protein